MEWRCNYIQLFPHFSSHYLTLLLVSTSFHCILIYLITFFKYYLCFLKKASRFILSTQLQTIIRQYNDTVTCHQILLTTIRKYLSHSEITLQAWMCVCPDWFFSFKYFMHFINVYSDRVEAVVVYSSIFHFSII